MFFFLVLVQIPFGLTILILPEAIPFLVWLVPGFLPTTFESDAERGKNRRTMEDKVCSSAV